MRGRVNQYNKLHCIILRNSHSHPNLQQPDQLAATNIEARPSTGQNIKICWGLRFSSVQFRSVTQLCPTLCDLMDCSTPGFPVCHQLPDQSLLKLMSIELVMSSNHLILCHPLLLLPSLVPSIRVFSSESVFHIRWPKYWSFSFSISPSNEYLGLISFKIDWLDFLAVQGTLKGLLQHHTSKASIL